MTRVVLDLQPIATKGVVKPDRVERQFRAVVVGRVACRFSGQKTVPDAGSPASTVPRANPPSARSDVENAMITAHAVENGRAADFSLLIAPAWCILVRDGRAQSH